MPSYSVTTSIHCPDINRRGKYKNWQSRDTGQIGYTTHKTKKNKHKNTTPYRKLKRRATRIQPNTGGEDRCVVDHYVQKQMFNIPGQKCSYVPIVSYGSNVNAPIFKLSCFVRENRRGKYKNWHSRDTGKIGYTTHKTKKNKHKNTTPYRKLKRWLTISEFCRYRWNCWSLLFTFYFLMYIR
jgi:hypothetical protein